MPKYLTIGTNSGAHLREASDMIEALAQHEEQFDDSDADVKENVDCKEYRGFNEGDRCFSHYVMDWGTVGKIDQPLREILSQGEPTGEYDTWYDVNFDKKGHYSMNDGGTHPMGWEWGRIVPPHIAKRYGYGDDPKAGLHGWRGPVTEMKKHD